MSEPAEDPLRSDQPEPSGAASQPDQTQDETHEPEQPADGDKLLEESQDAMQLPDTSGRAIEDEEMPSMVTISSQSRIDDSEIDVKQSEEKNLVDAQETNAKSSPRKEENNDSDDSVCVIDDDDDDEMDTRDRSSYEESSSYDEDEDNEPDDKDMDSEDMESEDMDEYEEEEEFERRVHYRGKDMRLEDEYNQAYEKNISENDVAEDDKFSQEYDEEYEDDENEFSEPEDFDGGSDDLVLRRSNGLTKHPVERSASLQDLSLIQGQSLRNRHTVNPFSQKARLERNLIKEDRRSSGKYSHVPSKVKSYIKTLHDQRKIYRQNRKKEVEAVARQKYADENDIQIREDSEIVMACKNIKNYTEKTLKEVAECEENDTYAMSHGVENGEISIFPRQIVNNGEPLKENQDGMDVDPISVEMNEEEEEEDVEVEKVNGSVTNEDQSSYIPERKGIFRRDDHPKTVLNGEGQSAFVCDTRTLTYEEYMKGSIKEIEAEVIEDANVEVPNESEKCNKNQAEAPLSLKIESVTSNFRQSEKLDDKPTHDKKTPTRIVNPSAETNHENFDISSMRRELDQRNTQFDSLRDAYQKTLSENMAMKMEVENLKKMLSYYKEKQKPDVKTKVTAVQTDAADQAPNMPLIDIEAEPRLATTSMISAMSSQWSDSTGSAAISMEPPPDVTNALNSDESSQLLKVPRPKNAFSRAFLTSSKILQTLSSITHGKTKLEKFIGKNSKSSIPETVNEASGQGEMSQTSVGQSNTRKRKASDTLEISSTAQPFKIPHTSSTTDFTAAKESLDSTETQFVDQNSEGNTGAKAKGAGSDGGILELDEGVKVFVYPEDESGKEHSFLIQAKEITNNPKPGVRECGPYLLGNVEVYMTEMNGTINIWGKELSQGSTSQNADELETSTRSKEVRPGFRWQSTPRIFDNQGSASTGKKSRVIPRFTQQQKQRAQELRNAAECENCDSHHRLSWPSCSQNTTECQHSCCPTIRVEDTHCGHVHREERRAPACCKSKFLDPRRYSLPNVHQENSCYYGQYAKRCKSSMEEEMYRHQPYVRRHSFVPSDDEADSEEEVFRTSKHCHSHHNSPHSHSNTKLVPPCSNVRKSSGLSDGSYQDDIDPLIFQKQAPDAQEVRKRRSSGRKVRGLLMDLLKGCGDCRHPDGNKTMHEPSTSAQKGTGCSPNSQSCSLPVNKKCSSCRNRNDKTVEIEAQLEFFRMEMDKLRSRSDTLRDMLDALRNDEIIN